MSTCAVLFGLQAFTATPVHSGFFDDISATISSGASSAFEGAKKQAGGFVSKAVETGRSKAGDLAKSAAAKASDRFSGKKAPAPASTPVPKRRPAPAPVEEELPSEEYDENGYDANGYEVNGLDVDGNPAPTDDVPMDDGSQDPAALGDGYDENGYDADGYNAEGYDFNGNDANGNPQYWFLAGKTKQLAALICV